MFYIGPVYSGERFRASGPSCFYKGEQLISLLFSSLYDTTLPKMNLLFNLIALKTAKTPLSFGCFYGVLAVLSAVGLRKESAYSRME